MFGRSGLTTKDRQLLQQINDKLDILIADSVQTLSSLIALHKGGVLELQMLQEILAAVSPRTPGPVVSLRVQLGRAVNQ